MERVRMICSAVALFLALPLSAEMLTFELDPAATTVQFNFGATLHTVRGTLRAREGRVRLDSATGTAEGRVVLDAASAQTGNRRRDRKMHEKVLESRRYPDIVFTVERVSGTLNRGGRSDIQLHGTLDWHGTRRPFALPAVATVDGSRVDARGIGTIRYMEWGLPDPSFFLLRVSKEVRIEVNASGHLSQ